MKNWSAEEETDKPLCPLKDDFIDARNVAEFLGIPLLTVFFVAYNLVVSMILRRNIEPTCLTSVLKHSHQYILSDLGNGLGIDAESGRFV